MFIGYYLTFFLTNAAAKSGIDMKTLVILPPIPNNTLKINPASDIKAT